MQGEVVDQDGIKVNFLCLENAKKDPDVVSCIHCSSY